MSDEAPERLSYRSELAATLSALVSMWWSPDFRRVIVDASGEELGVTEARILWELGQRGTVRPGSLAALLKIGAPSVSKAIAKLRVRGLVRDADDAADSRSKPIRLTRDGVSAARHLYEIGDTLVARVVEDWQEGDVRRFESALVRFVHDATPLSDRGAWSPPT